MKEELRHYLKRKYTSGSVGDLNDYKDRLVDKEELLEKKISEILRPGYIICDFETDTSTGIHICNHVEVDVLRVDKAQTHEYQKCLKKSFGINGYGCETAFCDWLFTEENQGSTVIAHNGAGYDNKFVLQYCLNKGLTPSSFIRQGSRITYMNFEKYRIRFVDSYHFLLQPLRKLPKTWGIDALKGHFPHV